MLSRLEQVFAKTFGVHNVSEATDPEDVRGWDSLGHMRLVQALEMEFQVHFEIEDIMNMDSIGRIMDVLRAKGVE